MIEAFGSTRISDFRKLAGANTNARFLNVECADDYYESSLDVVCFVPSLRRDSRMAARPFDPPRALL